MTEPASTPASFNPFPFPLTFANKIVDGDYTYYETSTLWKAVCRWLPCAMWLDWPTYASASLPVEIDGEQVIIQCWKGWCADLFQYLKLPPEFSGLSFPGGIGAEVGIYSLERPKLFPSGPPHGEQGILPFPRFPIDLHEAIKTWLGRMHDDAGNPDARKVWWADENIADDQHPVTFTLYDPDFDDVLIDHYTTPTYWTCEWMEADSFEKWLLTDHPRSTSAATSDQLRATPSRNPDDYVLEFTVADIDYIWKTGTDITPKATAG